MLNQTPLSVYINSPVLYSYSHPSGINEKNDTSSMQSIRGDSFRARREEKVSPLVTPDYPFFMFASSSGFSFVPVIAIE